MSEPVLIAVIGAGALIVAEIIKTVVKSKGGNKTIIKQNNKGKGQITQVGEVNINMDGNYSNGKKT